MPAIFGAMTIHAMRGPVTERQLGLCMIALRTLSTMYSIGTVIRNIFQRLGEKRRSKTQAHAHAQAQTQVQTGTQASTPHNMSANKDIIQPGQVSTTVAATIDRSTGAVAAAALALPVNTTTASPPRHIDLSGLRPAMPPLPTPITLCPSSSIADVSNVSLSRVNEPLGDEWFTGGVHMSTQAYNFADLNSMINPSMMGLAELAAFDFDFSDNIENLVSNSSLIGEDGFHAA